MGRHKELFQEWMEDTATTQELQQGPDDLIKTFINYTKQTDYWEGVPAGTAPPTQGSQDLISAYKQGFEDGRTFGYEQAIQEVADGTVVIEQEFDMDTDGPIQ